jgi:hypothetical protein
MVGDLLATFGTRSAVMVGDRHTDAEAAHAHGVPHVHLAQGFAPRGEVVLAEARIASLLDLLPRLWRRSEWIEEALMKLAFLRRGSTVRGGPSTLGVTGGVKSGKTLFARDAARLVEARGRPAVVVALDEYRRGDARPGAAPASVLEHVASRYDFEHPHRAGVPGRRASGEPVAPDSLLVLEGPFLLHPRLRLALDRVVHLHVDESVALSRITARDGTEAVLEFRRGSLPLQREFLAAFPPETRADLSLDASNPLGPEPS